MKAPSTQLQARLDDVRGRIAAAERRAGRSPGCVTLVAVVKTVGAELIAEALSAGVTDLGENRVQEAEQHQQALGRDGARWHMIGPLQRNKAGRALERFDLVHGVESAAVAAALARRAVDLGKLARVLVQVNVSGEASKHGVTPESTPALLDAIRDIPGLSVEGLMTVGAPVERAADARPEFVRLRALRDRVAAGLGLALPQLSMGMSGDYEVAVEEGSTLVRVGTAIFGARG